MFQSYLSNRARFAGSHDRKTASGIMAEFKRILGSDMYCILALYLINHSVKIWARYATTQGKRASCSSTTTVPDVDLAKQTCGLG